MHSVHPWRDHKVPNIRYIIRYTSNPFIMPFFFLISLKLEKIFSILHFFENLSVCPSLHLPNDMWLPYYVFYITKAKHLLPVQVPAYLGQASLLLSWIFLWDATPTLSQESCWCSLKILVMYPECGPPPSAPTPRETVPCDLSRSWAV